MNKLIATLLSTAVLVGTSGVALAKNNAPQEDARKMDKKTVLTRTATYKCQQGKKVSVKYGFNRQGLPTYAQAFVDGKTRFMPVNLYRSDATGSVFGDEDNYSLMGDVITSKNYRNASFNVQSAGSEIVFKGCSAY